MEWILGTIFLMLLKVHYLPGLSDIIVFMWGFYYLLFSHTYLWEFVSGVNVVNVERIGESSYEKTIKKIC